MRIAFMGEALIDFTSSGSAAALGFEGHVGGSPLNAAIACARLGQPTGLLTQLSTDLFGERILDYLQRNGVDTRFVPRSAAPSTLAFVERTPQTNRYAFYAAGSADATWAPDPLPELPPECAFLHHGSIAMLQQPAAGRILDLVRASAGRRVVVLDPNVRPSLIGDMALYRTQVAQWAGLSDVVKLSDEDAELLAPGLPPGELAAGYLAAGAHAVVVTQGAAGATLWRTGHAPWPWVRPACRWRTPSVRETPSPRGSRWRCWSRASNGPRNWLHWAKTAGARPCVSPPPPRRSTACAKVPILPARRCPGPARLRGQYP